MDTLNKIKYRIKSKQFFFAFISSKYEKTVYQVQVKYPYVPFWITITRRFNSFNQAEEHIKLKLKVYNE